MGYGCYGFSLVIFITGVPSGGSPFFKVLSGAIRTTHGGDVFSATKKRWKTGDIMTSPKWIVNLFFMEGIVNLGLVWGDIHFRKKNNVTVSNLCVAVEFIRLCFCTLRFRYGRWKESRTASVEGPLIYKHHVHVAGNKGQKYDLQTHISWHLWLETSYSPLSCFLS